ncbi:hypothetical protein [Methanobrevibacter sp.]|uniref:hypothetical protein n=1 Tax=Methanobrevibacter sp. TaxID=66852 RepID=UPI0038659356
MRNYKILLISFVLLIFMIGAVSAASNSEAIGDDGVFVEDVPVIIIDEEDVDDPGSFIPDEPIIIDEDDESGDSTSNTKDIYVNDTGDDSNTGSVQSPYATIKKALSDVDASDIATIHLSEGIFASDDDSNLQIDFEHQINGGSLTIVGAGPDKTFIDGQAAFRFAVITASNVTLKDISFIYFRQWNGAAIAQIQGTLTIENCIFDEIYARSYQGAITASGNQAVLTVKDSQFINCSVTGSSSWSSGGGGAIFAQNIAALNLINNMFIENSIASGNGVAVYSNSKSYIDGNKFINLTGNYDASICLSSPDATLINNEFINCTTPSTTYSIVNIAGGSCTLKNNTFINSTNSVGNIYASGTIYGLNVTMSNDVIDIGNGEINKGADLLINVTDDMGNIVKANRLAINFVNENNSYAFTPSLRNGKYHITFDMPEPGLYNVTTEDISNVLTTANIHYSSEPVELYVSPNGDDANNGTYDSPFATIQHALDAGYEKTFNVVIHLLEGTYSGEGNVELRIASKGTLQLIGEKYNETIIDGNDENGFINTDTETVIKNLKFVKGSGYQLISSETGKLSLENCIIDGNEGYNIINSANMNNVVYINNKGHSVLTKPNLIVNNSYFANNFDEDGSTSVLEIYWNGVDVCIENSKFINNTSPDGTGVLIAGNNFICRNNYFEGNSADNCAVIKCYSSSSLTLDNNTFVNNRANTNGVIGFDIDEWDDPAQTPTLIFNDCKFINNSAVKAGVATLKIGRFNNCLFINNTADYGGVFVLLPYIVGNGDIYDEDILGAQLPPIVIIDPDIPIIIPDDPEDDETETINGLELNDCTFENNIAKINGNDIYLEEKGRAYDDYAYDMGYTYQYVIPLTITFNDLNVTSFTDNLTATVSGPQDLIVGSAYDLPFEFDGTKIGSAKIINGVATFTYAGFDDGEYVLSGNTYLPNSENVVNDAKVIVKLENVIDNIEFWVSVDGSDETGNGSESNPFNSISHAIDEATKNCRHVTIHLAEGTYTGDLNTNLTISSMNEITLIGAGIDKTIIDGENANAFVKITEGKYTIVLSNLTIENMLPANVEEFMAGNKIVNYLLNSLNSLASPITIDEGANLGLKNVKVTNCRGGSAIIKNDGNLNVENSIFNNNGISSYGIIMGGNNNIKNTEISYNVAAIATLYDFNSLVINNSVIKDNFNLAYFSFISSEGYGDSNEFTIIENTVISNDGDNSSLSVIGYNGTYSTLHPALVIGGSVLANNISMINGFDGPLHEYNLGYGDGSILSAFGYLYGSGGKNVSVRNSTFINLTNLWSVNTWGLVIFDFDGCVFDNIKLIAQSQSTNVEGMPCENSSYTIHNSVFINTDLAIDRLNRDDRPNPNCDFNDNYWGSNDKPVIQYINLNSAMMDKEYVPTSWIILTSEDDKAINKTLTDGENSTDYTGIAPIREGFADDNGMLGYAVVFGPVGYLFTTDDEDNVIFNESAAINPFVDVDPMSYRDNAVMNINKINGSGAVFGTIGDVMGNPIANATIVYTLNGVEANTTTDENGSFVVLGGNGDLNITFVGDDRYFPIETVLTLENIAPVKTETKFDLAVDGNLVITGVLSDINGNKLANVPFTYVVNGSEVNATTDANGAFTIEGVSNDTVVMTFAGDDSYLAASTSLKLDNIAPTRIATVIESDYTFTRQANDYSAGERGDFFYATLKDINGNPIANVTCYVAVNGPIYNVTTDENGKFGVQVNLAAANTYTYALSFLGNEKYEASLNCSKLVLTAKKTTITAKAIAFKAKAKTKTISVTLSTVKNPYDGKTYLKAGKKLTMKLNGKTYTAKINAKGVAKFTIKLTKKGKYTAKITFAGDKTYKASSKSIKVTIK